jgi:hypothetical protein
MTVGIFRGSGSFRDQSGRANQIFPTQSMRSTDTRPQLPWPNRAASGLAPAACDVSQPSGRLPREWIDVRLRITISIYRALPTTAIKQADRLELRIGYLVPVLLDQVIS